MEEVTAGNERAQAGDDDAIVTGTAIRGAGGSVPSQPRTP
jgi:hypothetical protein